MHQPDCSMFTSEGRHYHLQSMCKRGPDRIAASGPRQQLGRGNQKITKERRNCMTQPPQRMDPVVCRRGFEGIRHGPMPHMDTVGPRLVPSCSTAGRSRSQRPSFHEPFLSFTCRTVRARSCSSFYAKNKMSSGWVSHTRKKLSRR
jgi:hypothetical protein